MPRACLYSHSPLLIGAWLLTSLFFFTTPAWGHEYAWTNWNGSKRYPNGCASFFSEPIDLGVPTRTTTYHFGSDHVICSYHHADDDDDDSYLHSVELFRRVVSCDDGYVERRTQHGRYASYYSSTCVPDPEKPSRCESLTGKSFIFLAHPPQGQLSLPGEYICESGCRATWVGQCANNDEGVRGCVGTAVYTGGDCNPGDTPTGVGPSPTDSTASSIPTPVDSATRPPQTDITSSPSADPDPTPSVDLDPTDSAFSDPKCFKDGRFLGADCLKGGRPTDADDERPDDASSDASSLDKDKTDQGKSGVAGIDAKRDKDAGKDSGMGSLGGGKQSDGDGKSQFSGIDGKDGKGQGKTGSLGGSNKDGSDGKSHIAGIDDKSGQGNDKQPSADADDASRASVSGEPCNAELRCEGDVIQCAILRKQKEQLCQWRYDGEVKAQIDSALSGPEYQLKENDIPVSGLFNEALNKGRWLPHACPAPQTFTVMGRSYAFSWEPLCRFAQAIGPLIVALASIFFAVTIARAIKGS